MIERLRDLLKGVYSIGLVEQLTKGVHYVFEGQRGFKCLKEGPLELCHGSWLSKCQRYVLSDVAMY